MTNAERIIAISKKLDLSHIGSNLSCLPVLEEIYAKKEPEDIVILDNAHAGLAHLVVQDWYDAKQGMVIAPYEGMRTREDLFKEYGIHCDRKAGCDASGGSLAHTGIAIGYALADRNRMVYLIVSDGSVNEGSFAEALRLAKVLNITNLEIHANFNSYTAVAKVDLNYYEQWIKGFGFPVKFHRTNNGLPEFDGINGHYDKYE
jgi:transketolase N-terminal domain/subunit